MQLIIASAAMLVASIGLESREMLEMRPSMAAHASVVFMAVVGTALAYVVFYDLIRARERNLCLAGDLYSAAGRHPAQRLDIGRRNAYVGPLGHRAHYLRRGRRHPQPSDFLALRFRGPQVSQSSHRPSASRA